MLVPTPSSFLPQPPYQLSSYPQVKFRSRSKQVAKMTMVGIPMRLWQWQSFLEGGGERQVVREEEGCVDMGADRPSTKAVLFIKYVALLEPLDSFGRCTYIL
ncbi:hypothetical protein ACFX13_036764 [Malus domestica]